MLRIAIPNKGALSTATTQMFTEAGYVQRSEGRELSLLDKKNGVEFFYLRPRDIAIYVSQGRLQLGVTGRDLLLDSSADADEIMSLGFGRSKFRFAAEPDRFDSVIDLEGKRIATSFPHLVRRHLKDRGVNAEVVRLDGAIETSIKLGVADAIADVVETGSTLKAAGLKVFGENLLQSEAILIGSKKDLKPEDTKTLEKLRRRLQGVLVARQYVMIEYDVPTDKVDKAVELTPGLESPTISALMDTDWVAVRAMMERTHINQVMDELYEVGARAILVNTIHACRI